MRSILKDCRNVERKTVGIQSLTSEERETIISWNDEDKDKIWIYTSQQPMIRRLKKNPLFDVENESYNKSYKCHPEPISVEGYLPKKALTIRTKIRKLTPEERERAGQRLKLLRNRRNATYTWKKSTSEV